MFLLYSIAFAGSPVVGGAPVTPGEWPSTVGVMQRDQVTCTGVLVAPRVVLTAAHCSSGVDSVLVGTVDWAEGGARVAVERSTPHPDWRHTYDVAVLHLAEAVKVPFAAVAMDCVLGEHLNVGSPATVVGFGAFNDQGDEYDSRLRAAVVNVRHPDCVEDGELDCNELVWPGGELVAGGDGVDACVGDSGGPLYLHTSNGPFLVGLVARGVLPAARPCGDGGVYTRVDAVVDWIEAEIHATLERPDCGNTAPTVRVPKIDLFSGDEVVLDVIIEDSDEVALALLESSTLGIATVTSTAGGATLRFVAGASPGRDSLWLRAVDVGPYPASTIVEVDVRVREALVDDVPDRGACACDHPAGAPWRTLPVWGAMLALLGFRRYASHSPNASSLNSEHRSSAVPSAVS